ARGRSRRRMIDPSISPSEPPRGDRRNYQEVPQLARMNPYRTSSEVFVTESIFKIILPTLNPAQAAAAVADAARQIPVGGLEKAAGFIRLFDVAWCGFHIPDSLLRAAVETVEADPGEKPSFFFGTFTYSMSYVGSVLLLLYDKTPGS